MYDGDKAADIAKEFCILHKIEDMQKQQKLLHLLEQKIQEAYDDLEDVGSDESGYFMPPPDRPSQP